MSTGARARSRSGGQHLPRGTAVRTKMPLTEDGSRARPGLGDGHACWQHCDRGRQPLHRCEPRRSPALLQLGPPLGGGRCLRPHGPDLLWPGTEQGYLQAASPRSMSREPGPTREAETGPQRKALPNPAEAPSPPACPSVRLSSARFASLSTPLGTRGSAGPQKASVRHRYRRNLGTAAGTSERR